MATRLVYHKPGAVEQTFPYDVPVVQQAQGRGLHMPVPQGRLPDEGGFPGQAYRLVTDLDAWIGSQGRGREAGRQRSCAHRSDTPRAM